MHIIPSCCQLAQIDHMITLATKEAKKKIINLVSSEAAKCQANVFTVQSQKKGEYQLVIVETGSLCYINSESFG